VEEHDTNSLHNGGVSKHVWESWSVGAAENSNDNNMMFCESCDVVEKYFGENGCLIFLKL
jgi:hypothetical protein